MFLDLKAEELGAYATALSAVIASIAVCVAAYQISVTRREARRGIALQIYKDYLKLAMDNPKFSSASYPVGTPRLRTFSNDELEYERYEYFVAHLLFAAEGILEASNDTEWRATLRDQLKYHALYLQSPNLLDAHFSGNVLALAQEAILEYQEEAERGDA